MNKKRNKSASALAIFYLFCMLILVGCQRHWTVSNREGKILAKPFLSSIPFEFESKLIVIPVTIKGETYRFLYDTGAPFSISNTIQDALNFKVVSKNHIKDSDNNRAKVKWVQVDTLHIGEVPFSGLTAFVGDFQKNPLLACFNIDGIIGSNNIRLCNWHIDYEKKHLYLTNQSTDTFDIEGSRIPFEYNRQYGITVELKAGPVTLKNMYIDTGSNGDISLIKEQFDTLVYYNQTQKTYLLKGVKQSGILGQVTPIETKHSQVDSLQLGALVIPKADINTGSSKLIGNEILSRYHILIDNNRQQMIFKRNALPPPSSTTYGFRPGSNNEGSGVFVQSVFSDSPASEAGIVPHMEILEMDSLRFSDSHNICDLMVYNRHARLQQKQIRLVLKAQSGDTLEYHLNQKVMYP